MNYIKKIGKSLIYLISILLISNLILTIFSYINVIKGSGVVIFKIIILLISFFISGFIFGKSSTKKGWLEGIKISLIYLMLLIIIGILSNIKIFEIKNIIFYLIIIITTTFGSMVGINKRKI